MKHLCILTIVLSASLPSPIASAQNTGTVVAEKAKPINAMCPIGKEPIVPSAGTVTYKDHTIGLCCPGCGKQFLSWEENRKDRFVALALRGIEPGQEAHTTPPAKEKQEANEDLSFPYPLDTCIVSGGKLGSMGDPIVKKYDHREVRFCCAGCIGRFEAEPEKYLKKADERIIKDQLRYYPTDRCLVMDEPLDKDGKDGVRNLVYRNRLVRLCCDMCVQKFEADPAKFLKVLDEAVVDVQRKEYPLDTCIVAGGALGSMGDPTEMIVAGRLLRFCCAGCHPEVEANPTKYLEIIDKAWQEKGEYLPDPEEE
ncbi:MAG: hypothetical protein ACF8NJ_05310 [Phycisphaerales bacterium JB038]